MQVDPLAEMEVQDHMMEDRTPTISDPGHSLLQGEVTPQMLPTRPVTAQMDPFQRQIAIMTEDPAHGLDKATVVTSLAIGPTMTKEKTSHVNLPSEGNADILRLIATITTLRSIR